MKEKDNDSTTGQNSWKVNFTFETITKKFSDFNKNNMSLESTYLASIYDIWSLIVLELGELKGKFDQNNYQLGLHFAIVSKIYFMLRIKNEVSRQEKQLVEFLQLRIKQLREAYYDAERNTKILMNSPFFQTELRKDKECFGQAEQRQKIAKRISSADFQPFDSMLHRLLYYVCKFMLRKLSSFSHSGEYRLKLLYEVAKITCVFPELRQLLKSRIVISETVLQMLLKFNQFATFFQQTKQSKKSDLRLETELQLLQQYTKPYF